MTYIKKYTAELARTALFSSKTDYVYDLNTENSDFYYVGGNYNWNNDDNNFFAEVHTQDVIQKWIRDCHKIHIKIDCNPDLTAWGYFVRFNPDNKPDFETGFTTYEKALESALQYVLLYLIATKKKIIKTQL